MSFGSVYWQNHQCCPGAAVSGGPGAVEAAIDWPVAGACARNVGVNAVEATRNMKNMIPKDAEILVRRKAFTSGSNRMLVMVDRDRSCALPGRIANYQHSAQRLLLYSFQPVSTTLPQLEQPLCRFCSSALASASVGLTAQP